MKRYSSKKKNLILYLYIWKKLLIELNRRVAG